MISKNNMKPAKSSNITDVRPIRDVAFQSAAKKKIVNFLYVTQYLQDPNVDIFKNMFTSDLKAIFEHFIRQVCVTYRLNESKVTWDKAILNFFSIFQSKSNFTLAHMKSPSLTSSYAFVVAGFDFMRRLIQAHINAQPLVMFPRIDGIDVSTGFVLDTLVQIKNKTGNNASFDIENALAVLRQELQKKAGVMTEKEKSDKRNRMNDLENVVNSNVTTVIKIKQIDDFNLKLHSTVEEERKIGENKKNRNEMLASEIASLENRNHSALQERSKLKVAVDQFSALGYDDSLMQLQEKKNEHKRFQSNCLDWHNKEKMIKKELREIETEIEAMKLHTLGELIAVDSVTKLELNEMMSVDKLLNFNTDIRPVFNVLTVEIEEKINSKEKLLDERKLRLEGEAKEYLSQTKEMERLKICEAKHQATLEKTLSGEQGTTDEFEGLRKEFEELIQNLGNKKENLTLLLKENTEAKVVLAREQQETIDARDFFDADLDFRKCIEEERLQSFVSNYDNHKIILDYRNKMVKDGHEFVEDMNMKTEKMEKETTEYYANELKKIRKDHNKS